MTLALASVSPIHAQTTSPATPNASSNDTPTTTLAPVIVTGNPLGSTELASPVTALGGTELLLRRGTTLGETLNGLPGVSSTYFGPNANRPVIRGLDGDRIRILNNGGASIDASSLSFDHAVPIDPLVVERVEVLRGPGALLYGGNAIGGVVNAIDNRIPKYSLTGPSGSAEVRLGGADRERGGGAAVETGNGTFALHADAFKRETSDLRVPRYTPIDAEGDALDPTRHVRNSASRASGGAVGASYTYGSGYLGISGDTYDNRYGIVAEEDVIIRMKRDRVALAGEARDLNGPLRSISFHFSDTRYRHDEVEGSGEIGTTFKTSGSELRVQAQHAQIGPLRGVIGAQIEDFDFSALGEEAFVPSTKTRRRALFVLEELASPVGTLSVGFRVERASVSSKGDADMDEVRFGEATQRRFTLHSASIGDVVKLGGDWTLTGSLSSTARAPTSFELFANGVHAATGTYERGDPSLKVERGNNLDVAAQWKSGANRFRVGAYVARFSRFISLQPSGRTISQEGEDGPEDFPEYVFRPVRAKLAGIELEGSHRLLERLWTLDISGKLDYTRATQAGGEPLPRIAPLRAALALDAGTGPWRLRFEMESAARQRRVPDYDTSTAGYTLFNASVSHRFSIGGFEGNAFLKAINLGDKLAYSASTIETIRGLVPLPGRAVKAGLQVMF
ncbi:TonB-dependent receptor [Piscinibacter koreensis]|uniref:TonB-dependent receptor n=1 Tax=Piscinibacter koreensis TaxID=2742824 RepID=UPI001FE67C5E|nr:TonB-dependent receptor [Schlegelella koreensis]